MNANQKIQPLRRSDQTYPQQVGKLSQRRTVKKIIQVRRRHKWDLKQIVNAVLCVTENGCVWRDVPGEFPPWQTVYYDYAKWVKDGTWKNTSDCLTV